MQAVATLLTLGYEKRGLDEFIALLVKNGVGVLLDVRETAWSHKPGFSKGKLQAAAESAGIAYVHAKIVGNPKRLRREAPTHAECLSGYRGLLDEQPEMEEAFDGLIREALLREKRVCLMCFERHPDDCHRGILAERWAERHNGQVRHLAFTGAKRLITEAMTR